MHMATKPQTDSVTGGGERKVSDLTGWMEGRRIPLIFTRGSWMLIPIVGTGG